MKSKGLLINYLDSNKVVKELSKGKRLNERSIKYIFDLINSNDIHTSSERFWITYFFIPELKEVKPDVLKRILKINPELIELII